MAVGRLREVNRLAVADKASALARRDAADFADRDARGMRGRVEGGELVGG